MLVWLASYPKSGNTWVRTFLANYLSNTDEPVSINSLNSSPNAASRRLLDSILGLETADFGRVELLGMRSQAYRFLAKSSSEPIYLKTHDKYEIGPDGPLFTEDSAQGVVYIVRDPRDVAVSYAHHGGCSLATSVRRLADANHGLARIVHSAQVQQLVGDWSSHVSSWLDCPLPLFVLRYEELSEKPEQMFGDLLNFLSLPLEGERLQRAIEQSSFESLRKQEALNGFRERSLRSESFFRSGRTGDGRRELSPELLESIARDHKHVMSRLGYL